MTPPGRTGAIIAGGRGRRLGGRDKSRLVVGGRSIIDRQIEILQQVAGEVIVVGAHPGRPEIPGIAVWPDRVPDAGAMGGVLTALEVARGDLVIVVAGDMPFLEASLLDRLAILAAGADAAWVRTPAGVEPLVACYQRAAGPSVRTAVEAGRLKLADLAGVLQIVELSADDVAAHGDPARLLFNVNTPDDYERIQ